MVNAGGLMAYGPSFGELYRRAASQVHKILQGANPAKSSGRATNKVRVRAKYADSEGARPYRAANAALPRR